MHDTLVGIAIAILLVIALLWYKLDKMAEKDLLEGYRERKARGNLAAKGKAAL